MSMLKNLGVVAAASLVASAAGGYAGFYAATHIPVQVPIAVVDIEAITKMADPNAPDYKQKVRMYADIAQQQIDDLVAQHVIVLDRAHILAAPPEAMVNVRKLPR